MPKLPIALYETKYRYSRGRAVTVTGAAELVVVAEGRRHDVRLAIRPGGCDPSESLPRQVLDLRCRQLVHVGPRYSGRMSAAAVLALDERRRVWKEQCLAGLLHREEAADDRAGTAR